MIAGLEEFLVVVDPDLLISTARLSYCQIFKKNHLFLFCITMNYLKMLFKSDGGVGCNHNLCIYISCVVIMVMV